MLPGTKQAPSLSRTVHYVRGQQHLAAIITDPDYPLVESETAVAQALTVFPPMEPSFEVTAFEDPTGQRDRTWHFPEYVPPVPVAVYRQEGRNQ